jgi:putative membrane protein
MKKVLWWMLAVTGVIVSACDDDDNNVIADTDRNFMVSAAQANQAEIELGELAASKSTTEGVREFGQMMQTEHQTALNELESIADDKDVDLPSTLDAKHQQLKQRLTTLIGYSFDTAYMNSQVADHAATEALFRTERDNGQDQRLREYAAKYLPHIQMHFQEADSISRALAQ